MKFLITFVILMLFMVTIYANENSENNSDTVTSDEVYSQTQKQQQSASPAAHSEYPDCFRI